MQFRPCIDIHEGKVKQIVGGSLRDTGDATKINFVSGQDSAFYAKLYAQYGIRGLLALRACDSPDTARQSGI